jgi:rhamnosyltransferase
MTILSAAGMAFEEPALSFRRANPNESRGCKESISATCHSKLSHVTYLGVFRVSHASIVVHVLNVMNATLNAALSTAKSTSSVALSLDAQLSRKIVILLAAYNGAGLVSEQIRSIQRQTISNWTLFVRDDDSEDNTRAILEKFAAEDRRIRYVHDTKGRLGAAGNFGELMRVAFEERADAIFFSDQDDVWLPHKLARQLRSLQEMERRYGPGTPLLCYSDLEVVDQKLHQIHPSFMRYEKLRHESHDPIHVLLTQNIVTGCAVVINRDLLEFVTPIPNEVILHDWWLAICAAACGRIGYIDEPLVQYRQHSRNQIGALTLDRLLNLSAAQKRLTKIQDYMLIPIGQAKVLSERIRGKQINCSGESLTLLDGFVSCLGQSTLRRLWTIYQLPLRRQGPWRKLLLFLRLLLMRNGAEMKLMHHHDQLDGGGLLSRMPSVVSSERNESWRGLAAKNERRRVVNSQTEEQKIV